jgi:alpha-L-arabinofuranosidase
MRLVIILLLLQALMISAQEIQKNIFGFATSNTFTYCNISDTSFINKVCKIKPQILRFPGGAVGNFYHFGKAGYGFDYTEIDKYHDGKFPKRARGLDRSRKKYNHQHDYIHDFITLAQRTDAKAVLVANPFVSDDNDILLMIQKLYDNNIEVIGVELGSELSNRSYFLKGYTIDEYILFAKRCSKNIKIKFPKIKTAVLAAPLGKRKGHRHNIWNNRLASLNFYDAIIIHSYAKIIKGKTLDGQMISEKLETKNKSEEFEIYKSRVINYFNREYPKEVKEYFSIYNKPVWVTEWNLQISKTTGSTLLQSLFVAQYILEVFSNPNLASIELATYHNLGGRDFSGSIFRKNHDRLDVQSTYYPMTMVSKIFDNEIFRIEKEIENEVFSYKCYDKYNKKVLTYIVDWSSNQLSYINNTIKSSEISMVYKSKNLFDKSNNLGVLDFKIYESHE